MPFDFLIQLRASYLLAWVVCFAGLGRVITDRPASVEHISSLLVISIAFVIVASVTLLALRIEWCRRLVLRESASLDKTKPGLSLLTTVAYALSLYGAVYAFELWSRS